MAYIVDARDKALDNKLNTNYNELEAHKKYTEEEIGKTKEKIDVSNAELKQAIDGVNSRINNIVKDAKQKLEAERKERIADYSKVTADINRVETQFNDKINQTVDKINQEVDRAKNIELQLSNYITANTNNLLTVF